MDLVRQNFLLSCPVKVLRSWHQIFLGWCWRCRRMDKEAREEISKGKYDNALLIYERLIELAEKGSQKFEVFLGKAETLIFLNRFSDAVDCYRNALGISELKETDIVPFIDGLVNKISTGVPTHAVYLQTHERILCPICQGIILDPVTLPCGHTSCHSCTSKLKNKVCKVCSKPFCSYKVKVNVVLQGIMKKHYPSEEKASTLRLQGNDLLKENQPEQALEKYSEALELHPGNPLLWSNISHVMTQLGRFQEGLENAIKACELYPDWPKGYYRKGCALIGLQKNTEAAVAFLQCLSRDSSNTWMKKSTLEVILQMFHQLPMTSRQNAECSQLQEKAESKEEKCQLKELIQMVDNLKVADGQESVKEDSPEPCEKKAKKETVSWKDCDAEDFECTLCCRLFYEPVTTPCGHVFCRSCLDRSLDHNPGCPICRSSLSQVLASRNQAVTIAVEQLMQTHLAEQYEERKKIHLEEMERLASVASNTADDIPIFVCTLAFPMMPCPLHIFEPRYRLMVRQCMESGAKQFGMCAYDEDTGFSEYGTMLEIDDVQFLADGRSLVNTVGGRRFKVLSKGMRDGYSVAKVEWIADEPVVPEEEDELKSLIREIYDEAKRWFDNLPLLIRRRITNSVSDIPSWQEDTQKLPHGPQWLWWFVAICPLDPKTQTNMLGLKSLKERLVIVRRVLTAIS